MDEREKDMETALAGGAGSEDAGPSKAPKRAWQPPALTYIGDLEDLVQGGGKRGSFVDGDPRSSRKGGGG